MHASCSRPLSVIMATWTASAEMTVGDPGPCNTAKTCFGHRLPVRHRRADGNHIRIYCRL
jgi:hypothetical protein